MIPFSLFFIGHVFCFCRLRRLSPDSRPRPIPLLSAGLGHGIVLGTCHIFCTLSSAVCVSLGAIEARAPPMDLLS